jgi:crossover junction endodeoxyribonuclease RuvC
MLTGSGRAPKLQMQNAICREFGLLKPPEPPDVADALAIALCQYYVMKTESLIQSKPKPAFARDDDEGRPTKLRVQK